MADFVKNLKNIGKRVKHKFAGVPAPEQARRDRNKAAAAQLTRDMLYDERTDTFRGPAEIASRHPSLGGWGHDLNDVKDAVAAAAEAAEKHARDPARQNDTIDEHISVGLAQFQNEAEKLRLRRTRQGGRGNYAPLDPRDVGEGGRRRAAGLAPYVVRPGGGGGGAVDPRSACQYKNLDGTPCGRCAYCMTMADVAAGGLKENRIRTLMRDGFSREAAENEAQLEEWRVSDNPVDREAARAMDAANNAEAAEAVGKMPLAPTRGGRRGRRRRRSRRRRRGGTRRRRTRRHGGRRSRRRTRRSRRRRTRRRGGRRSRRRRTRRR